ncbi:MAG: cation:proton antiporter [Actinomycetales bacterium]
MNLPQGEIFVAAALVLGIATTCQVVAPKLRVPALVLLLPAGFLLGFLAPQFRWDVILGPVFPVAVDLVVALILFQGGMSLGAIKLERSDRSVVRRLIWAGGSISCLVATLGAHFFLGLAWPLAFLLGAILIVSGPTVVTPILDFAKPEPRSRGILLWEGTLLDPIGAIFAVTVFQVVRASTASTPVEAIWAFLWSFVVAILFACIGVLLAVLGVKLVRGNAKLGTQVLIGSVISAVALANACASESGLMTALLMGAATYPLAKRLNTTLDQTTPFFDVIASIGVGVLFVCIAALVPSPDLAAVVLPAIAIAATLILMARPFIAWLCTRGAGLSTSQRTFIGWMDPRGIVAAATASSVSAALVSAKVPGAQELLPAAFVIIAVTVFVYGLTAVPVVRVLKLTQQKGGGT